MLSAKEKKQMWTYIILLTLFIGGLRVIFLKNEIRSNFNQNQQKQEKSLGEIFSTFGQSVSKGVEIFSEIKNQLPETVTNTISTTTDNLVK